MKKLCILGSWYFRFKGVSIGYQQTTPVGKEFYYIPIHDASFELSVFWPSDTDSRII